MTQIAYAESSAEYRVYVACLAAYNNGILHGAWIDCDGKIAEDIDAEVQAMLKRSPVPDAEEYAIHDFEGFGNIINEYTSIDEIAEIVDALESADEPEALKAYAANRGESVVDAASSFDDAYFGEWDSELAYAEDYMDSYFDIPDRLANYIDYEAFRRDLFCGDYWSEDAPNGNVYVFQSI